MKIELRRKDDSFLFEAVGSSGIPVYMDASPEVGGNNQGARPMELLLMGLAGCGAIDIVIILKKQRAEIKDFIITVNGQRKKGTPSPFEKIHIHYKVVGSVTEEQLKKAAHLSITKYCSAVAQMQPTADITYSCEVS